MAPREKLKSLRKKANLKQREIANELRVTIGTVSNWELGISLPTLSPRQTWLLCELLHCSLEELIDAVEEKVEEE
jgi:transcriptional regulator with XRE-family HTH domain